ncbi:MAG: EpsG family protein, partial [Prevotellaceae bacterium]|nr:EpsG family protein [Prevotellaceae bacterium]
LSFKSTMIFILSTAIITIAINNLFYLAVDTLNGYDSYMESEVSSDGNYKMALIYLLYFVVYAFLAAKNRDETLIENFFFKVLGIAFILQFAGSNFVLMQRLNLYFSFSLMIIIPYIVKMIKYNEFRVFFVIFTVILYSYIMFLDFEKDRYSVTPYNSLLF